MDRVFGDSSDPPCESSRTPMSAGKTPGEEQENLGRTESKENLTGQNRSPDRPRTCVTHD